MKISFESLRLQFIHPFRLAQGTRHFTETVLLTLHHKGYTGYGEASLPPYLGESVQSVTDFIQSVDPEKLHPEALEQSLIYLDELREGNFAAKAAFDIALHDLACQVKGVMLSELLGISTKPVLTSFTIGISTPEELAEKLEIARPFTFIKLKLGGVDDKALITEFRNRSDKPFFADVNQGWKNLNKAIETTNFLKEQGCVFIEQPFHFEDIEAHRRLKEEGILPVFADESIRRVDELKRFGEAFDGVNIKLMKSTGIAEAMKMFALADEMDLMTVMGCMAESSCAVRPAVHLASLANFADLDGPFLFRNDPFHWVGYRDGEVIVNRI